MTKRITIFESKRELKPESVPRFAFDRKWTGERIAPPVECSLAIDPKDFHFLVSFPRTLAENEIGECGRFVEGLWEGDVAEVFLASGSDSRYQEINLSPSGAWWTCCFSSYRVREAKPVNEERARVTRSESSDRIETVLSLSLENLFVGVSSAAKGNITAIVGGKSRVHLSYAASSVTKPDFHLAELFQPIELKTI